MQISTFHSIDDVHQSELKTNDIIQFEEKIDGLFWRPEKIQWVSVNDNIKKIEDHFPKKEYYSRWKEMIRASHRDGYIFAKEEMTSEFFNEFYAFYIKQIGLKSASHFFLKEDWPIHHATKKHVTFGYSCRKNGLITGGMLGYFNPKLKDFHASYLAVDHSSVGITAGLQELLLNDLIESGSERLHYGKDRNLYGIFANPGLIYNKIRFGLMPHMIQNVPSLSTLFLHLNSQDNVFFYSPSTDSLDSDFDLTIIGNNFQDSIKKYMSEKVTTVNVKTVHDVLAQHANMIAKMGLDTS